MNNNISQKRKAIRCKCFFSSISRHTTRAFVLLFLLFSLAAVGQTEKTAVLALDDVIFMAQKNSYDALIAKHRFLSSYWYYKSFRATYRPQMALSATLPSFNRSIDPVEQPDGTTEYIERQYINNIGEISIDQKVGLTGGNISLTTGLQRYDNISSNGNTSSYLSTPVNLVLSQPLFTFNSYKWDKKIEPLEYEEAKRSYLEQLEQVSIEAVNNFFQLVNAEIKHNIALKNQANYDTLFNVSKGRFELGKIPENDLLQMELSYLKATSQVESTKLNYDLALFQFKSFLRIASKEEISLLPPREYPVFEINTQTAFEEASTSTTTGLSFEQRALEADRELDRAKKDGRFDMNVFAVIGLTQTADNIPDAYRNPLDQERVQVGINLPIVDWGVARGKIKVQESNKELVYQQIEQDRIDYEQQIYLNVARFNMQSNQLVIAAKADTVAQKSYDITQRRYMIGKDVQFLELNNAQIANDNAKISYYNQLNVFWNYYFTIRKMTLYDFEKAEKIALDETALKQILGL